MCGMTTHSVVLDTSFIPRKGSSASGERRMQGANTIARELGDILLCSSSFATLKDTQVKISRDLSHTNTNKKKILLPDKVKDEPL